MTPRVSETRREAGFLDIVRGVALIAVLSEAKRDQHSLIPFARDSPELLSGPFS
jgi:hypothetical protein